MFDFPLNNKSIFFEVGLNLNSFFFTYFFFLKIKKKYLKILSILSFSTNFLKKMSYLIYLNYKEFSLLESYPYILIFKYNIFNLFNKETITVFFEKSEDNLNKILNELFDDKTIENNLNDYFGEDQNYLNIDDKIYL